MDKKKELSTRPELLEQLDLANGLNEFLESKFREHYQRSLPMADHLNDRWERAERLGFGKGSNVYDSSYIIGDVAVGENCWIGMFTILDGSGGLKIGNFCTISAGVHIYSHDNVKATLTSNGVPIDRQPVKIGNNCYVGPHSIISKGVELGDRCLVAAHSFVNRSFPENSILGGVPARQIGRIEGTGKDIVFTYFDSKQ